MPRVEVDVAGASPVIAGDVVDAFEPHVPPDARWETRGGGRGSAFLSCQRQLDLALVRGSPRPAPRSGRRAGTSARRGGRRAPSRARQLEEVARQPPRRQEALEDVAEADEQPGADQAGDLARRTAPPSRARRAVLEQPREADVVGAVLDLAPPRARGPSCARRAPARSSGSGLVARAELAQQRAVARRGPGSAGSAT